MSCPENYHLADEDTAEHLAAIIERAPDEEWRGWAETWALKVEGRFQR